MQLQLTEKQNTEPKKIKLQQIDLRMNDHDELTDIKLNVPENMTIVKCNKLNIVPNSEKNETQEPIIRRNSSEEFLDDESPFTGFEDQPIFRIADVTNMGITDSNMGITDLPNHMVSIQELPIVQSSECIPDNMNNIGNIVEIVTTPTAPAVKKEKTAKSSTRSGNRSQNKDTGNRTNQRSSKVMNMVIETLLPKPEVPKSETSESVILGKENVENGLEDAVTFLIENVDLSKRKSDQENKIEAYEKRKHKCQVCGKRFVGKSNLVDHLRFHANVKPYKCTLCHKSFVQSGSLQCHMRIHTNEKPYSCPICQRSFSQTSSLKIHIRTHTHERKYACDICDKRFMSKSDLSKHKRIHESVKRYQCDICNKGFAQNVNLQKHFQNNHNNDGVAIKNSKKKH